MPVPKQPEKLRDAAHVVVTRTATSQVRAMMYASSLRHDATLAALATVVGSLPAPLVTPIVEAVLECVDSLFVCKNHHPARRLLDRLLRAILPPHTASLHLRVAHSYPLRMALLHRISDLRALRELHLSVNLHVCTSPDLAVRGLMAMRQLAVLSVPWICSDRMLEALEESCPLLRYLDASDSIKVTDECVAPLSQCNCLQVVLLTGCSVSVRGYEALLRCLPRLERIGRCPDLDGIIGRIGTELSLTAYQSDGEAPSERARRFCPRLSEIEVCDAYLVPSPGAPALDAIKLAVSCSGLGWPRPAGPRALRVELGPSLEALEITQFALSVQDLAQVGRMCPVLRVLRIMLTSGVVGYTEDAEQHPIGHSFRHDGTCAPFSKLEDLYVDSGLAAITEYVLTHARDIRQVTVLQTQATALSEPNEDLAELMWTDDTLVRVFSRNPMLRLESLVLSCSCALTMQSVYRLLTRCPALRRLRDVHAWNVSRKQLEELDEVVTVNNWDLDIGREDWPLLQPVGVVTW